MTDWIKLSSALAHHPKILAAGGDATLLYVVLLAMNGRLERDGHLRALETSEPALLHEMHFAGWDLDRLQAALAAAESAGLLERSDSGLSISGWDDAWRPPMTATERSQKWRAAQAQRATVAPATPRNASASPGRSRPPRNGDATGSATAMQRDATLATPKKEGSTQSTPPPSEYVPRTSTKAGRATATRTQAAPGGAGVGGVPETGTQTQTRPKTGGELDAALAGLGIDALADPTERAAVGRALAESRIDPADVQRLATRAAKASRGDGKGLLLTWLRSPARAVEELAAHAKANPSAVNGADLDPETRAADLAKAEEAAEARRDRLRELATALDDLELDDGIPARRHAERLDDAGLGLDELARLDGLARATNAAGETDPDDDPDGRGLLSHWLRDPRLARMALDGGR